MNPYEQSMLVSLCGICMLPEPQPAKRKTQSISSSLEMTFPFIFIFCFLSSPSLLQAEHQLIANRVQKCIYLLHQAIAKQNQEQNR